MPLSIIIPAAGISHQIKSSLPKVLTPLRNEEPLIVRQVRLFRERFPKAKIIVVLGYEAASIRPYLKGCHIVVNHQFAETNVAYSIALGMKYSGMRNPLLIAFSDLCFSPGLLEFDTSHSWLMAGPGKNDDIGINIVDGHVGYMSFGLPIKWRHIAYLKQPEQRRFVELAIQPERLRYFAHEILNELIDEFPLRVLIPKKSRIVEVDCNKDIEVARSIV